MRNIKNCIENIPVNSRKHIKVYVLFVGVNVIGMKIAAADVVMSCNVGKVARIGEVGKYLIMVSGRMLANWPEKKLKDIAKFAVSPKPKMEEDLIPIIS
ncbi:hypothetical protein ES708_19267 [subsurface metagenome]